MLAKTKSFISVVASWEGEPPAVPYAYYNKHADSAHVSRLSYFLQTNMIRSDDQKQKPAAELNVLPALRWHDFGPRIVLYSPEVQGREKRFANFAKLQPGRARQKS